MKKSEKKYTIKDVYRMCIITGVLLLAVICIGGYISSANLDFVPFDELTANYISFNNSNTTDMIKVSNLERLSDTKGISFRNRSNKDFQVLGNKNQKFKIILYHIGTVISDEYIHFSLSHKEKEIIRYTLDQMQETPNGGKIIYEGVIKDNEDWNLKMWVDHSYKGNVKNISYEIRIQ